MDRRRAGAGGEPAGDPGAGVGRPADRRLGRPGGDRGAAAGGRGHRLRGRQLGRDPAAPALRADRRTVRGHGRRGGLGREGWPPPAEQHPAGGGGAGLRRGHRPDRTDLRHRRRSADRRPCPARRRRGPTARRSRRQESGFSWHGPPSARQASAIARRGGGVSKAGFDQQKPGLDECPGVSPRAGPAARAVRGVRPARRARRHPALRSPRG